jgi:hypothetical protein
MDNSPEEGASKSGGYHNTNSAVGNLLVGKVAVGGGDGECGLTL